MLARLTAILALFATARTLCGGQGTAPAEGQVSQPGPSFTRDVRPLLAKNCFPCHGPDEQAREADLRLDDREVAIEHGAIIPSDSASSLAVERITALDPELVMPPADSGLKLTEDQIGLVKRWIDQGAEYTPHWSFVPPVRPKLPSVINSSRPANPIDHFVLRQLEDAGLSPAAQADAHTLVRRLYLDLTGIPPTPEAADAFAVNPSQRAYERLVDELLASPRFGEHWARVWLDVARYADTKGYEKDFPRDMWPYRDWVIRALNEDMPFDQFTVEQLAGDLLPDPSRDQLIATAFHRNTMSNDEGGTDDEEFRVAAVKDRVDTTMQVWMGLTAGCAKCHSHKFDPVSHEEYYSLFAIFNQTADRDSFDEAPVLRFESDQQGKDLTALRRQIQDLKEAVETANQHAGTTEELKQLEANLSELEAAVVKLPVMREVADDARRTTHVHLRGNFLELGAAVLPGTPAELGAPLDGPDVDRLALANWLVADANPLTARVAVNRVWARFFGAGIVESEGDFGSQGTAPTHPELLDWLAVEFRDVHKWSLKQLCKAIVLSSAYRQSSAATPVKQRRDPRNQLISRGPRLRLPAETVRDQALHCAGLLSTKMHGPPVMPPQPEGVWKSIYNARQWETSEDEDRYRRAVYTYWKRTSPYPSMLIFDAESREVCTIRRINTNTPLQALVLMNDPVYLEAAASLAKRMITEGDDDPASRLCRGFRLLLIRPLSEPELERLKAFWMAARSKFQSDDSLTSDYLASCNVAASEFPQLAPADFASYVAAASVLLNLDEAVTRH
jgi:hypothetical protein